MIKILGQTLFCGKAVKICRRFMKLSVRMDIKGRDMFLNINLLKSNLSKKNLPQQFSIPIIGSWSCALLQLGVWISIWSMYIIVNPWYTGRYIQLYNGRFKAVGFCWSDDILIDSRTCLAMVPCSQHIILCDIWSVLNVCTSPEKKSLH